jgi:4-amino-4-deoxy-L-arabinose transferase-like glycosyltransferase
MPVIDGQPPDRAVSERWPDWRWLLVLSAVALFIRVAWMATHGSVIENEGAAYARVAQNLLGGGDYASYFGGRNTIFPPLYPIAIAGLSILTGDAALASRLLSCVCGVGLIWPVYGVAMYLGGRRSALIAAVLVAGSGLLVALSASTYSESTYFLLLMAAIYFSCRVLEGAQPVRHALGAGVSFGCAYLVRPEALAWAALALLFVTVHAVVVRRPWRRTAVAVAVIGVSVVLIASPYVAWLSANSGYLRWEGKSVLNGVINAGMSEGMTYQEAAYGLGPNLERLGPYLADEQFEITAAGRESALIASSMLRDAALRLVDVARTLAAPSEAGGPALAIFALIGLVASLLGRRGRVQKLFFASTGATYIVVLLSLQFQWDRYLFPLVLLALPWVAAGIAATATAVSSVAGRLPAVASRRRIVEGAVIATAMALVLIPSYRYAGGVGEFTQSTQTDAGDLKAAGLWLRDREASTVMGMSGVVPYYAGAELAYLPWTTDEGAALRYVHSISPDFVYLRNGDEVQNPYIGRWVSAGIPDPCAVPVKAFPQSDGGQLSIYEWRCSS